MTKFPDKSAPLYNEGWRIAVIYFGLVSFGLAQPVYESVYTFRRQFHFGPADAFLIVLAFQCLPAAVLISLRRLARKSRLRFWLDAFVIIVALTIALRQMKVVHLNTLASSELKFIITAGLIIAVLAVLIFFRRAFMITVFYAGFAAPAFGAFFVMDAAERSGRITGAAAPASSGPAVVLVISDQLTMDVMRKDGGGGAVDAEKFPNFARLAARSVFWANAASNYPVTRLSVPSFLTSRLRVNENNVLDENLESAPAGGLFDIFEEAGYRIYVYSDHFGCEGRRFVCGRYLDADRPGFLFKTAVHFIQQYGPGAVLDRYFPSVFYSSVRVSNDHLINTVRSARPGSFHFVHLMTTHEPYVFDPDGNYRYTPHRRFRPGVDFEAVLANYRDQAMYMDKVIGAVTDAFDARAAEEPLILMVTSDSGICQVWETCTDKAAEMPAVFHIPAILMSPLHAPRTDYDDFQSIDLAPTLCEAAGLKTCAGRGFEGVPRLNGPPPPRPRRFFPRMDGEGVDLPLPVSGAHAD
ncbi:MAG: sulfatase-like hydrolase/transferase [Rhodospirillales bacterium]